MNLLALLADIPLWREDALAPLVGHALGDADAREELLVPCQPHQLWVREDEDGLLVGCGDRPGVHLGRGDAGAVRAALEARARAYLEWTSDLHAVNRDPDADLNGLLAVAWRFVGRSFVLFDGGFDFLAYAGNDVERSAMLAQTIKRGYAVGVSVAHQREYRQLQAQHPTGFATVFEEEGRRTPVWACTVRTRLGRACQLHVMGLLATDAGVHELVEEVVAELRIMLERFEANEGASLHDDFVQVLVDKRLSAAEARRRAAVCGWAPNDAYRVARMVSTREQFAEARWGHVRDRLRERVPLVHASIMGDGLTLVVPADTYEGFCRFGETLGLTVGVSDERRDLTEAPDAYVEAVMAAERTECGRVGSYDSHKLTLLVEALQREACAHNVVPEFLRAMKAYDGAHGSSFAATLEALVACGGSKALTCERLLIHRSTLDYRLGRIRELFGIDPLAADVHLHLRLLELGCAEGRV